MGGLIPHRAATSVAFLIVDARRNRTRRFRLWSLRLSKSERGPARAVAAYTCMQTSASNPASSAWQTTFRKIPGSLSAASDDCLQLMPTNVTK